MKVQVKFRRGGQVKSMEKRYADILIKAKEAELYEEPKVAAPKPVKKIISAKDLHAEDESKKNTYQTKVMTAEE